MLPPELYLAVIKYQAKKEVGKPFAGLLLLTLGAYQQQLISKETYEALTFRYSRKLVNDEPKPISKEELAVKQAVDEKARRFSWMLSQWRFQDKLQRANWVAEAEAWKDKVPNAQLVIDLGRTQT